MSVFRRCFSKKRVLSFEDCIPLSSFLSRLHPTHVRVRILDVYDGDTVTVLHMQNDIAFRVACRLEGFDAPEMKYPTLEKAKIARDLLLREMLSQEMYRRMQEACDPVLLNRTTRLQMREAIQKVQPWVFVKFGDGDKYGRILVKIQTSEGKDVSEQLLRKYPDYFRVYDGKSYGQI